MQAELVGDLSRSHGLRKILLVREDQDDCITELVLVDHLVEFLTSILDSVLVIGVNHENQTLSVRVVVSPEGTDLCECTPLVDSARVQARERTYLVLTTHIPNSEGDVLVLDSLHVEANGGDGSNNLTKLELVEDGGLSTR